MRRNKLFFTKLCVLAREKIDLRNKETMDVKIFSVEIIFCTCSKRKRLVKKETWMVKSRDEDTRTFVNRRSSRYRGETVVFCDSRNR